MAKKTVNPYDLQFEDRTAITPSTEPRKKLTVNPYDLAFESAVISLGFQDLSSKYDVGISRQNISDVDKLRYQRQSGLEQFGAFLNQAVVGEIVGGTIEGVGYLLDLEQYGKLVTGQEQDFGNWFSDLGKDLKTWSKEATPIYTDPDTEGQFRPDKWSWWMSNAPSVASTLSLMIPAAGAVKGASMLGKAMNIGTKMGKTAKWATTGISQAVVSRHMENLMEASGIKEDTYQTLISEGISEKVAQEQSARAASDTYKYNWAMLVQDIPQYLLLNGAFSKSTSSNTLKVAKTLGMDTGPLIAKKGLVLGADMLSEGGEEAYQYIVSQDAKYLAEFRAGIREKKDLPERLKDYLGEGELWTSAFFGAIGAGVMQTAGRPINKAIQKTKTGVDIEQEKIDNINSWSDSYKKWSEEKRKAMESKNEYFDDVAGDQLTSDIALRAAENGNTENLVSFLNVMKNPSPEDIETFGISEEDVKTMQIKIPEMIKVAERIGQLYDKNVKVYDDSFVGLITRTEYEIESLNQKSINIQGRVSKLKSQIPNIDKLSSNGRDIFDIDREVQKETLIVQGLKQQLTEAKTKEEKTDLRTQISEKNKFIKSLETQSKKLYEEKTPEELKSDTELDFTSAAFNEYNSEIVKAAYTQEALKERQKDLKKYINTEWQTEQKVKVKKKIEDEIKKDLDNATTPEEVENVINQTENTEFEEVTQDVISDKADEEQNTKSEFIDRYAGNPFLFKQEKDELVESLTAVTIELEDDITPEQKSLVLDNISKLKNARNVRDFETVINEIKSSNIPLVQDIGKIIDLFYEEKNKTVQDQKDITPNEEKNEDEPSTVPTDSTKDLKDAQDNIENQTDNKETGEITEDEGVRQYKTTITNIAYLANKYESHRSEQGESFIMTSIDPKTGKIIQEEGNERRVSLPEFLTPGSDIIMFIDTKNTEYNNFEEDFTRIPIAIQSVDDYNSGQKPKLWLHRLDWISEDHIAPDDVERVNEETKIIRAKLFNFQHGIPFLNKISDKASGFLNLSKIEKNVYDYVKNDSRIFFGFGKQNRGVHLPEGVDENQILHLEDEDGVPQYISGITYMFVPSANNMYIPVWMNQKELGELDSYGKIVKTSEELIKNYLSGKITFDDLRDGLNKYTYAITKNNQRITPEIVDQMNVDRIFRIYSFPEDDSIKIQTSPFAQAEGKLYDTYIIKKIEDEYAIYLQIGKNVQRRVSDLTLSALLARSMEKLYPNVDRDSLLSTNPVKIPKLNSDLSIRWDDMNYLEFLGTSGFLFKNLEPIIVDEIPTYTSQPNIGIGVDLESIQPYKQEKVETIVTPPVDSREEMIGDTVRINVGKYKDQLGTIEGYNNDKIIVKLSDGQIKEYSFRSIEFDPTIEEKKEDKKTLDITDITNDPILGGFINKDSLNINKNDLVEYENLSLKSFLTEDSWEVQQRITRTLALAIVQFIETNKGEFTIDETMDRIKDISLTNFEKSAREQGWIQIANNLEKVINNFEPILDKEDNVIFVGYREMIKMEIKQMKFNINEFDEVVEEEGDRETRSWDSEGNFRKDPEKSMSAKVKRLLSSIEKVNSDGTKASSPIGLVEFEEYNKIFNYIANAVVDLPVGDILNEIKDLSTSNYIAKAVHEKLSSGNVSEQELNEFIRVFRKQRVKKIILLFAPGKEGSGPTIKVINSNRFGARDIVFEEWLENFKEIGIQTGLLIYDEGNNIIINNKKAGEIYKQYTKWLKADQSLDKSITELQSLFKELGIDILEETLIKINKDRQYTNENLEKKKFTPFKKEHKTFKNLFGLNGELGFIFTALNNNQKQEDPFKKNNPFLLSDKEILKLANYQVKFKPDVFNNSFRNVEGNLLYGYANPHNESNLVEKIKNNEEYRNRLKETDFASSSYILNEEGAIDNFDLFYLDGFKNFKSNQFGKPYEGLSPKNKEQVRLSLFQNQGNNIGYLMTGTPSDKTTFSVLKFPKKKLQLGEEVFFNGKINIDLNSQTITEIYEIIKSEASRINSAVAEYKSIPDEGKNKYLINGYHYFKKDDKYTMGGAKYFYLFPFLNGLVSRNTDGSLKPLDEGAIRQALVDNITKAANFKISEWQKNEVIDNKYKTQFDKSYIGKISDINNTNKEQNIVNYAVLDYIINADIFGLSNVFQLITGDPALFVVKDTKTWQELVDKTSENIFKRIAGDIAPGEEGNFARKTFNTIFINEPFSESSLVASKRLGESVKNYTNMDIADAQEWTTAAEHIEVMFAYGEISKELRDSFIEKLNNKEDFTPQELSIIFNPRKPVYTFNQFDDRFANINVHYYIKTSSFPLLPQLVKGAKLDKLRIMMERDNIDRAVVKSGVKVGFRNSIDMFTKDGIIEYDSLKDHIIELDRSGFRIQQNIPYDPRKNKVIEASQYRKLKYADLKMDWNFNFNNQEKKGHELKTLDDQIHTEYYRRNSAKLIQQLEAVVDGDNKLNIGDVDKLKKMLVEEAITRGYSYNDIMTLKTIELQEGKTVFDIPLYYSNLSDKIEPLLNSIIKNKILKNKIPGFSAPQGSSIGFEFDKDKISINLKGKNISWVKGHDGKQLDYKDENGELYAEVVLPFYFKDRNGNPMDVNNYTDDQGFILEEKIDKALLELVGLRIPYQGFSSIIKLKVVGFLPRQNGDLVIVPAAITKQMGSDFDIDKIYVYNFNYKLKDNFIERLKYNFAENEVGVKTRFDSLYGKKQFLVQELERGYEEFRQRLGEIHNIYTKEAKFINQDENIVNLLEEYYGGDFIFSEFLDSEGFTPESYNSLIEFVNTFPTFDEFKELPIIQQFSVGQLQNMSLDITMSILANEEVQKLNVKELTFDPLVKVGETIKKLYGEDITDFNIKKASESFGLLNSEHHKHIQDINADGQIGIGALSNTSTYHALSQYAGLHLSPIRDRSGKILEETSVKFKDKEGNLYNEEEIKQISYFDVAGKQTFKSIYEGSNKVKDNTYYDIPTEGAWRLDKVDGFTGKSILEVISYIQSLEVDIAKNPEIAFNTGLNRHTFGVAGLITRAGFDEEFVAMFLKQPIIQELIEGLKGTDDITSTEFNPNKEDDLYNDLFKKLGISTKESTELSIKAFSLSEMEDMIKSNQDLFDKNTEFKDYNTKQAFILNNFRKYKNASQQLAKLQRLINVDTRYLEKSLYSSVYKFNELQDANKSGLFGNFDNMMIGTTQGSAITYGLDYSIQLFNSQDLFPLNAPIWRGITDYIVTETKTESQLKDEVINNINSGIKAMVYSNIAVDLWAEYLTESTKAGTIRTKDIDINELRKELLYGERSLVKLIQENKIKLNNSFLNILKLNKSKNKDVPDTIEYITAKSLRETVNFNNSMSWNDLLNAPINSIEREIGIKLVMYTFLFANNRGQRDFGRFLPYDYMENIELGRRLREFNLYELNEKNNNLVEYFTTQWFQHNPFRALTVISDDIQFAKNDKTKFTLKKEAYDKYLIEKGFEDVRLPYTLMWYDIENYNPHLYKLSDQNIYEEIPILGTKQISEYSMFEHTPKSLIREDKDSFKSETRAKQKFVKTQEDLTIEGTDVKNFPVFEYGFVNEDQKGTVENIKTVLENIQKNSSNTYYSNIAEHLLNLAPELKDWSTEFIKENIRGRADSTNKILYINPSHEQNLFNDGFEYTFLHELTHSLTVSRLNNIDSYNNESKAAKNSLEALLNKLTKSEEFINKIKNSDMSDIDKERILTHGLSNIREFVSFVFTDQGLQEILNETTFSGSKSILDRFFELIKNLLNFDVKKGSDLDVALNDIFTLLEQEAQEEIKKEKPDNLEDKEVNNLGTTVQEYMTTLNPELRQLLRDQINNDIIKFKCK